ncbi:MAG TPA: hypothetical protein VGR51_07735 [Thermoplasmata archaeon]|jgi:hypothetical protein|nr:hypothetical protein [Thermoplasmata archaeon]
MRNLVRTLALVIAVALLSVSVAPSARADAERPTWTAGDYWLYAFSGIPLGGGGGGPTPNGTMRIEVIGLDSVTVGGTVYSTYHTSLLFNLTFGSGGFTITLTVTGDSWYRTSDLGLAKEIIVIPDLFGSGGFTTTATYAPPQEMRWPLQAGTTWTATSLVTMVQVSGFGTNTFNYTESTAFSVQAEASITVPAGTFSTVPVRGDLTAGGYTLEFWAGSVGNAARTQTFDDANQQQTSGDLKEYRYQAGGTLVVVLVLLLLLVVIVAVVAGLAMRRRKRGAIVGMPPGQPPWQPQPGVPPQQPYQPPYQPPQQPPP